MIDKEDLSDDPKIAKCLNPTCGARFVKYMGCCDEHTSDYWIKCACGRQEGPNSKDHLVADWKETLNREGKLGDY